MNLFPMSYVFTGFWPLGQLGLGLGVLQDDSGRNEAVAQRMACLASVSLAVQLGVLSRVQGESLYFLVLFWFGFYNGLN